jgi:Tol biopolymer transport system component
VANVLGESVRQIALPNDTSSLYLSDVWSPDGNRVLFQHVTSNSADLVLLNAQNNTILRQGVANLVFPRFGMTASWSPLGNRIAIGGTSECPYGVRVSDEDFDLIAIGTPPPTMCNPQFSPDGRYIGFSGISLQDRLNPDGRIDIYTSSESGFSQQNLTADLRGTRNFIGWLGGK